MFPGAVPSGAHQGERESRHPGWRRGLYREEQEQDYSVLRGAPLQKVRHTRHFCPALWQGCLSPKALRRVGFGGHSYITITHCQFPPGINVDLDQVHMQQNTLGSDLSQVGDICELWTQ